jgi:hypothetical protein
MRFLLIPDYGPPGPELGLERLLFRLIITKDNPRTVSTPLWRCQRAGSDKLASITPAVR